MKELMKALTEEGRGELYCQTLFHRVLNSTLSKDCKVSLFNPKFQRDIFSHCPHSPDLETKGRLKVT